MQSSDVSVASVESVTEFVSFVCWEKNMYMFRNAEQQNGDNTQHAYLSAS